MITGLLADVIASNRKILEDVQYHVRRMDYDGVKLERKNKGKAKQIKKNKRKKWACILKDRMGKQTAAAGIKNISNLPEMQFADYLFCFS